MKIECTKAYKLLFDDCVKKFDKLSDRTMTDEEFQKAVDDYGEAMEKFVKYGYLVAYNLENAKEDLYSKKWWFKLFTKLGL